jgi:hypothetical protein
MNINRDFKTGTLVEIKTFDLQDLSAKILPISRVNRHIFDQW